RLVLSYDPRAMGKHAVRFAWVAIATAGSVLAGGCNAIVGVDFGAVHAAGAASDDAEADGCFDATGDGSVHSDGPSCTPKTCTALGFTCGTQDDGCGNALECGTCAAGKVCNTGQCACVPTTCPALGVACGTVDDGCGGALQCGTC